MKMYMTPSSFGSVVVTIFQIAAPLGPIRAGNGRSASTGAVISTGSADNGGSLSVHPPRRAHMAVAYPGAANDRSQPAQCRRR